MKTRHYFKIAFSFIVFLCFVSKAHAQTLESQIDLLLSTEYKADAPGATAIVVKKGKVIYRKAFGLADLELNVPMIPEHVIEVRSITKQFTAISILMLMEQGKLSLDDEITKFIPDYPTQGKTITIHHLLTHTSGIQNYVGMKSFVSRVRTSMTPTEMINFFKNEPMDFDPGEEFKYNNSAYFLLGYIIEKLSGETYGSFIENQIFKKLGMSSSLYGNRSKIVKNRAAGYQNKNGYINSNYMNFSVSYSAGGMMTTIDDLAKWQDALNNNRLIKKETLKKAFTNHTLNNGEFMNYGYGWFINEINGTVSLEHGGSYLGFDSYGIYISNEDVYVVVLASCDCNSTSGMAIKMAGLAIGKPYLEKKKASLSVKQLQKWVGSYQFKDVVRSISLKNGQLYSQREDSTIGIKIRPVSANEFYFDGGILHYEFSMKNGKKQALMKDRLDINRGLEIDKRMPTKK